MDESVTGHPALANVPTMSFDNNIALTSVSGNGRHFRIIALVRVFCLFERVLLHARAVLCLSPKLGHPSALGRE